ncbi:hypothetical protein [Streptomyces sp. NPDC051992]|uniref:hypothetical protein n=1 Tax=Streptomyces sp. NPDC051992 TaxID=3161012 RepID=UPI00341E7A8E
MPKNRSSRTQKLAHQAAARTNRGLPSVPRIVTSPADARAALEQVGITGAFPMAGPDGQVRQVTWRQISDWHHTSLAAKEEPPLEPGELTEILLQDLMFGRLRLRTDGLWESSEAYFADGDGA